MTYRILADRAVDGDAAWLAARAGIVTASESAHLMGKANPYWAMTEEELAAQKASAEPREASPLMLAGTFWENHILEYLEECAGLYASPSQALYGSESFPWMGATPDGFAAASAPPGPLREHLTVQYRFELFEGDAAVGILHDLLDEHAALVEVKNQRSKDRSKWNKPQGGPAHYENQAQHQLAVLDDYDLNLLVAKVDANELYVHVIERDELYQELLVATCGDFYKKFLDTHSRTPENG